MAFTGDMSQQAANGEAVSHNKDWVSNVLLPKETKIESAVRCDFPWAISSRHSCEATEGKRHIKQADIFSEREILL
jgi:hypothetical protein